MNGMEGLRSLLSMEQQDQLRDVQPRAAGSLPISDVEWSTEDNAYLLTTAAGNQFLARNRFGGEPSPSSFTRRPIGLSYGDLHSPTEASTDISTL